ncbi:MAG: hypothetical protein ACRDCW_15905 [Sarcina sp.]
MLKNLIIRNKIWVGITSAIYTILFFIFSGSLALITSDFKKLTKDEAIKEFCTIGNFEVLFLILATGIIGAVYFMNKEAQLELRLGEKKDRVLYFKESLILLIIPILFAGILSFMIKAGLFGVYVDVLAGKFKIPFHVVFNTSIYIFIVAIFGVSISFLFQITMKPILTAALYPLFIFESFILIFGVSNLFISEKIPGMMEFSNFISELVLKYLNMFMSDLRVEMLGTPIFFTTILAFIAGTVVCLAGSSRFLVTYKEKTLTHSYRSTFLRRFIFIVLVTLFTMYLSIAAFGGYSMFVLGSISLDEAFEYTGIVSIILIPILAIVIEYFYMRRNNLIVKKEKVSKKKKKNKGNVEITKNIENNVQNIDVKINLDVKVNEVDLESKGIVKETVKTSYIPKDEEGLGETRDFGKVKEILDIKDAFIDNVSNEDSNEELFFDEDIIIKDSTAKEKTFDEIKEVNTDDTKVEQDDIVDTLFFVDAEENK